MNVTAQILFYKRTKVEKRARVSEKCCPKSDNVVGSSTIQANPTPSSDCTIGNITLPFNFQPQTFCRRNSTITERTSHTKNFDCIPDKKYQSRKSHNNKLVIEMFDKTQFISLQ